MGLRLDSFILKWWTTAAVDLYLWNIQSNSTSCNIMTFLCFLEALLASQVPLCIGLMVLFKVYGIVPKRMKIMWELQEITFLLWYTIYLRQNTHTKINITWCFKGILATPKLTTVATGGSGYKVITVVQCVLQQILGNYSLIFYLYIYPNCKWYHVWSVYA